MKSVFSREPFLTSAEVTADERSCLLPTLSARRRRSSRSSSSARRRARTIVITRNGKPVARLVPVEPPNSFASIRGIYRGQITVADDFDELPDDIAEAFGMR